MTTSLDFIGLLLSLLRIFIFLPSLFIYTILSHILFSKFHFQKNELPQKNILNIYTNICCSLVCVNWQFSFSKFVLPFVTEWSWFLKKTYIQFYTKYEIPNPTSNSNRQKVRNVSECLYGDFRQVDGSADIYKFSVLLLFCWDFRVGLFIVLLLTTSGFFSSSSEHCMDIWFTIILLWNSFYQSSNFESTTKIWRWKVVTWKRTRKKIGRKFCVVVSFVCVYAP